MYAGHAALAVFVKSIRPRIPMAVLVPIAFAPDWIDWFLTFRPMDARMPSHGLISIAIGSTSAALIYWLATRRPVDALWLGLLYVSHWFADLITGLKPTWPGGPDIGLMLYGRPKADVLIESIVIVCAAWAYQRSIAPASRSRRRLAFALVAGGLIGMQIGFILIQTPAVKDPLHQIIDSTPLGGLSMRIEDDILVPVVRDAAVRMPLARLAREPDSSESWPTTEARPVS
jgi:hypothetical protein